MKFIKKHKDLIILVIKYVGILGIVLYQVIEIEELKKDNDTLLERSLKSQYHLRICSFFNKRYAEIAEQAVRRCPARPPKQVEMPRII